MYFANSGYSLECNYFYGYVCGLYSITCSAIVLLHVSQRRSQGVFGNSRQGVRAITRAGRATYLIANVGVGRAYRVDQLVNCSACQTSTRAYGAGRSVLNGIKRCFGRVTIICRALGSVFRVVQCIQIDQSGYVREYVFAISVVNAILLLDLIRVIL